ncbi:hypothetical protein AVEN_274416-1 [Araneus ventricosus]|uniref:Uncharacterized protein n=1 Tax=Araneus ventricosus TaxID=182803 RepID=A0A4Y2E4A0_ARAVE|nr:hypothetical protein AVEN_274416-1 [Araneus ventricosus]
MKQAAKKLVPSSGKEIPGVEESFPQLTEQQNSLQGPGRVWTTEQPDDLRATAFNFPLHLPPARFNSEVPSLEKPRPLEIFCSGGSVIRL